jgi:hypothetical protein
MFTSLLIVIAAGLLAPSALVWASVPALSH